METVSTQTIAFIQSYATTISARINRARTNERGEGVISAALAVLIVAFLAAAMWVAYKKLFDDAATTTATQITKIGG
jgi:hypothetical protein